MIAAPPATSPGTFLGIVAPWRDVFPQRRTYRRAVRQAVGSLLCLGRRCLSRIIWTHGGQHRSWSADILPALALSLGAPGAVQAILTRARPLCRGRLVGVAVDDTRVHKTGRCIPQAAYHRDPLSPPFHVNLIRAIRFLQPGVGAAAQARPVKHAGAAHPLRGGIVRQEAPANGRPRRLDRLQGGGQDPQSVGPLRHDGPRAAHGPGSRPGAPDRPWCRRSMAASVIGRVCGPRSPAPGDWPDTPGRETLPPRPDRGSGALTMSPSSRPSRCVRTTPSWQTTKLCYGGKRRRIRYKEVPALLWQGGAGRRSLRLFVVAPTPYRKRHSGKTDHRQPAYLLTTDQTSWAHALLQIYFDCWQIEVNHREEKDTLGIGQAQLWNATAVPKQPALSVAAYSALLLAALVAFGAERGPSTPRCRSGDDTPSARRASNPITLLRQEVVDHPELVTEFHFSRPPIVGSLMPLRRDNM